MYRYARRFAVTTASSRGGAGVTVTIDLGPVLKARAEKAGSDWLERELTIGRLGVHLARGKFVLEDLRIGPQFPNEPPWLVAKRIEVSLTWSALFGREILLESIEMSDWRMTIESFPDGRQNFPRLSGRRASRAPGRAWCRTTCNTPRAPRRAGRQRLRSDWRAGGRNFKITVTKAPDNYQGLARFTNGTIVIQKYEPMSADMSLSFKMNDGKMVMDRIDLLTDGAVTTMTGVADLAKWPEQLYQVRSKMQFPRQREIFFARDKFALSGDGDFIGTFHMYKGGRELKGKFTSPVLGFNDYRFPNLEGDVIWVRDRMEVTRATAEFSGGTADFRYLMAPLGKKDEPRARCSTRLSRRRPECAVGVLQDPACRGRTRLRP